MLHTPYFPAAYLPEPYFPRPVAEYSSLEESLVAELRQSTTLAALLGTHQGAARIFDDDRPHGAPLPVVLYAVTANPRTHHLDGRARQASARVTLEVQGKSRAEVRALADLIIPLLCDRATPFRLGGGGVTVLEVLLDDEQGGYVQAGDGTDQPYRWIDLDFVIRYREQV